MDLQRHLRVALAVFAGALAMPAKAGMGLGGNSAPVVDSVSFGTDPVPATAVTSIRCAAHETDSGHVRQFRFTVSGGTLPGGGTVATVDVTPASPATGAITWTTPGPGAVSVTCEALDDDTGGFGGANAWSAPFTVAVTTVVSTPPPVVDRVTGPSADLFPGARAALSVEAHDPAGGTLSYAWTATAGTIQAVGPTATWTAPASPGTYVATVTVSSTTGLGAAATITLPVVLAGYEGSLAATPGAPQRLAVSPSGELYVVDAMKGQLLAVSRRGDPMGAYPLPGRPVAVAFGADELFVSLADGRLLALDPGTGRILRAQALGAVAVALACDPSTGVVWTAERELNRVRALRPDGSVAAVLTTAGATPLVAPAALAVDAAHGTVWVALLSNESGPLVHAFTLGGAYVRSIVGFGGGAGQVTRTGGLAVDGAGQVYVADVFQGHVQVVTAAGVPVATLGSFGTAPGQLQQPADVAVLPGSDVVVLNQGAGRLERYGTGAPLPTCPGDSDCDGMPDVWELLHGLDPSWAGDALLDVDHDGLTDLAEYLLGTNPDDPDSDGDGVPDGAEIAAGSNPLDPSDHRPTLVVPGPKESDPGLVRFTATLSGPAGCTVVWRQRLGPPVLLRGAGGLTPSFVGRTAGRYQLEGVATCGGVQTAPAVLEATIRNVPPRPDPGRMLVVADGDRVALDGRGSSDANGDELRFEWDQTLGPPLSTSARGPVLPLRPRQPGFFELQLTAVDPGGASASREVPLLVLSRTAETPTAIVSTPVTGPVGEAIALDATGSTGPAGALSWSWAQVDGAAVVLDAADGSRPTFFAARPGHYAFEATVTAGPLRSPPARVDVYVSAGEALPLARVAPVPATVPVGEPILLDGSRSAAAGGGVLAHRWRQRQGPAAGLTDADRPIASAVPFEPGIHAFELVVAEGEAVSLPATVTVLASAPGRAPPVAVAAGPGTAWAGALVTLDASGSGGPAVKYRWTQVGGPWVALDGATAQKATFTPRSAGLYVFELEVDRGGIRGAPATVSVLVFSDGSVTP
ncbi:PKD domain-containing protein [Anaeromyxobacter oryzae]|uniref:PKD/Chitinase domain-containing protein n=1 Tax=Anaeromyxobacter oryzae TaxID=2918170 RepID=A0ABN6MZQ9_9BACT|nr:hypothetical protein [Anaeromyxobacter oryzae]BDG05279.1 hypothetical protein AMOR_42750 [Anaeromyxobacter oryzae]